MRHNVALNFHLSGFFVHSDNRDMHTVGMGRTARRIVNRRLKPRLDASIDHEARHPIRRFVGERAQSDFFLRRAFDKDLAVDEIQIFVAAFELVRRQ